MMRRHVAAVSSSVDRLPRLTGPDRTKVSPTGWTRRPARMHPREGASPARLINAVDSAVTCVAARVGGTYRKVSGRLRKVTDSVTTDAPGMGQVATWTRQTSPHSEQCSAPPISPRTVETAYRQSPTAQPGHAGGLQRRAVARKHAATQGDPRVAAGAPCQRRPGCPARSARCHPGRRLREALPAAR